MRTSYRVDGLTANGLDAQEDGFEYGHALTERAVVGPPSEASGQTLTARAAVSPSSGQASELPSGAGHGCKDGRVPLSAV